MNLRKLEKGDCQLILNWMKDEREFYIITGGTLGTYPITADALYDQYVKQEDTLLTFIAEDPEHTPVGHFALRIKGNGNDRLCYVVVDKDKRGQGLGESMVKAACRYAFDERKAEKVTLAVFQINEPALNCYKKIGFDTDGPNSIFDFMGGKEACYEMALYRRPNETT